MKKITLITAASALLFASGAWANEEPVGGEHGVMCRGDMKPGELLGGNTPKPNAHPVPAPIFLNRNCMVGNDNSNGPGHPEPAP